MVRSALCIDPVDVVVKTHPPCSDIWLIAHVPIQQRLKSNWEAKEQEKESPSVANNNHWSLFSECDAHIGLRFRIFGVYYLRTSRAQGQDGQQRMGNYLL